MQKIISLFKRNYEGDRLVYDEVVEGAEWVVAGEGSATQKLDGTCCMIRDGRLYKRYTLKRDKKAPRNFEPATEADPVTGKQEGWIPAAAKAEDIWHSEAFLKAGQLPDGTYELCGPKVQGNPERCGEHLLIPHGAHVFKDAPRTFGELRDWFKGEDVEGIVWHHPDGRMVKIKKKDFGLKREE